VSWAAAALAAFGITALLAKAKAAGSAIAPKAGSGWVDRYAPARIRAYAAPIEELANWPGLGDFLVAVAWTESRGNPAAVNHKEAGSPNVARGWFQLRPSSARVGDLGLGPDALFDEPTAVALAAWYAARLRKFAKSGQKIDWLAVRRGWALPSRVSDTGESNERSVDTRKRFADGVAHADLPSSFMYQRAFPSDYHWPGIEAVFNAVGRTIPGGAVS
jgi:soluble lytic murein transglycosylase-like protein